MTNARYSDSFQLEDREQRNCLLWIDPETRKKWIIRFSCVNANVIFRKTSREPNELVIEGEDLNVSVGVTADEYSEDLLERILR